MSKFTFSIFLYSQDAQRLIERGYFNDDLGFIYLYGLERNDDAVYSYEAGLMDKQLSSALIF